MFQTCTQVCLFTLLVDLNLQKLQFYCKYACTYISYYIYGLDHTKLLKGDKCFFRMEIIPIVHFIDLGFYSYIKNYAVISNLCCIFFSNEMQKMLECFGGLYLILNNRLPLTGRPI